LRHDRESISKLLVEEIQRRFKARLAHEWDRAMVENDVWRHCRGHIPRGIRKEVSRAGVTFHPYPYRPRVLRVVAIRVEP
jgi:hypothetical protein